MKSGPDSRQVLLPEGAVRMILPAAEKDGKHTKAEGL
jgi:hypothetical protein